MLMLMMIELDTWMRRGESLGMGRSLSANRFMYWEPSKDISPDSVILLIFLKVGNSRGFFTVDWREDFKIQQRDADMRLFSGPPPTLYSSTQCPLSLARSHCRGVSQVERRSDALGWPDAQIWTFILVTVVTHNSGLKN